MTTTMLKVQKGVPLVPIDHRPKQVRRKWPLETMEPGDFAFDPGSTTKSISAYISRSTKHLAGTFTARRCWAWQDKRNGDWTPCEHTAVGAVEGVGVWRLT